MPERRIEVVDYDPEWTQLYEREALDLRQVFRGALIETYHVGSTSVPGIRAKPTIDILVEVEPGTDIPAFDPLMRALKYVCRGEGLDATVPGKPGRFYYVRKDGVVHLIHVHVCATGHVEIEEILAFRDYLRAHPDVATRYGDLKTKLTDKFAYDNIGYMLGKDAFVKAVLEKALQWRSQRP